MRVRATCHRDHEIDGGHRAAGNAPWPPAARSNRRREVPNPSARFPRRRAGGSRDVMSDDARPEAGSGQPCDAGLSSPRAMADQLVHRHPSRCTLPRGGRRGADERLQGAAERSNVDERVARAIGRADSRCGVQASRLRRERRTVHTRRTVPNVVGLADERWIRRCAPSAATPPWRCCRVRHRRPTLELVRDA
jgi:hypothetical protein